MRRTVIARLSFALFLLMISISVQPLVAQEATPNPKGGVTEDWLMTGANPGRTGATIGPGLPTAPVERWRIPVDLSQQAAPTGPLIAGNIMVLFTWGGQRLHAYDLVSGAERWQADVGTVHGAGGEIGAAIGNGTLYIFGTAGRASSADAGSPLALYALDIATGAENWRLSFAEEQTVGAPLLVGSRLVFPSEGPSGTAVTALDIASGQQVWQTPLPTLALLSGGIASSGDTLYVAAAPLDSAGGILLALDSSNGAERWQTPTAGWPRLAPVVAEGIVYVTSFTEDAYRMIVEAVDSETGGERWQFVPNDGTEAETLEIDRLAAAHGLVYVDVSTQTQSSAGYGLTNSIVALDGATGTEQWRSVDLDGPVVAGEVLYANTFDIMTDPNVQPALVAVNAATGNELWRLSGNVRVMAACANLVLVESHEAIVAYGLT